MKISSYRIEHGAESVRIAVTADLHSRSGSVAAAQLAELKPDIICAPGDIMNAIDRYSVRESFNINGMNFLTECRRIAPVYYSLGNHERGLSAENRRIIEGAGVTVLDNEYVFHKSLKIGGLSSGYRGNFVKLRQTPMPDVSFIEKFAEGGGFKLLLCHHPEYWERYIRGPQIELTLAGHAHGGQWQIPIARRGVFAPGQGLFPKYTGGVHENRLVISRGMANTTYVPRFFNPREIVIVDLI